MKLKEAVKLTDATKDHLSALQKLAFGTILYYSDSKREEVLAALVNGAFAHLMCLYVTTQKIEGSTWGSFPEFLREMARKIEGGEVCLTLSGIEDVPKV